MRQSRQPNFQTLPIENVMASNPYLSFSRLWGIDYNEALSFVDAYKMRFNEKDPRYSEWHKRAVEKFKGTDAEEALTAICRDLVSGGEGDAVRCFHTELFHSQNGVHRIYIGMLLGDKELVDARFLYESISNVPCRGVVFIIEKRKAIIKGTAYTKEGHKETKSCCLYKKENGEYYYDGDKLW